MTHFLDAFTAPPVHAVGGLRPAAAALLLSRTRATGWVIVPTREEADQWLRALEFFDGAADGARADRRPRKLLYPADDGRPWDGASPDPDLGRMRLFARAAGTNTLVVAPAKALLL